jgi:hypothetical protein
MSYLRPTGILGAIGYRCSLKGKQGGFQGVERASPREGAGPAPLEGPC